MHVNPRSHINVYNRLRQTHPDNSLYGAESLLS